MSNVSRRDFLKRTVASGVAGGLVMSGANKVAEAAEIKSSQLGSMIDLTKCDGCKAKDTPACVVACKTKNSSNFPVPVEDIHNYWPQDKYEDWSDKKGLTDRLTPYNWTFVQKVKVEHEGKEHVVNIPRRCMHCDNPACVKVCPFSSMEKKTEGPVVNNTELCFGGAKCRDVCPWEIPARQAGVGLYLKIAPKYVGAGVMYKCDLCYDDLKKGDSPACVSACPNNAILFGEKEEMRELAKTKAAEIGGYIYGDKENGGTSTFYVSSVPFDIIHKQIAKNKKAMLEKTQKPPMGIPGMEPRVGNFLETPNGMAKAVLIAPIAGAFAAGYTVYKTMKGEQE